MPIWLLSIFSHWSIKAIVIVAILGGIVGGGYLWGRRQYNIGYQTGFAKASEIPRNTYTGPTTVNQITACPAPTVIGFDLGKIALGLVFKK